ncbi:site-specific integrase [Kitasatospora sp. A2-31]|uniref:tyrosine-type recombinase/integrase n=1 Tax=Kitasatospora sp. A2-31 TaxID=2916414 RepID=UPI001EEDA449|nr:site-specific integrase [Kitasatospora sp. A2-31]MCG6499416.1 site-specific integrase [Kitasatospora sp. A2-31]
MAGYIEDRWLKKRPNPATGKRERTALWGKGKRYKVAGIPGVRSRSFHASGDAKIWLAQATTKKSEGRFVDPRDGQILLEDYIVQKWWPSAAYPVSSRASVKSRVWRHIIPYLGHLQLLEIDYEALKEWKADLLTRVGVTSAQAIWAHLSTILETARKAKRIVENPCREHSELKPTPEEGRKAKAWSKETVDAIRAGLADRYRVMVDLGVGLGLRQGEALGLAAEDFDWDAEEVFIQRQLRFDERGRPYFCLPKGKKTRRVPVAPNVAARIRAHIASYPPVQITLPWQDPEEPATEQEAKQRKPRTARLIVLAEKGTPVLPGVFNTSYWKPALEHAGIVQRLDLATLPDVSWRRPAKTYGDTREHGFHCLRHTYASVNLGAGENPVTVSTWMGHATVKITLEVYGHMVPGAVQRGRSAINAWFEPPQKQILPQDSLEAAVARWAADMALVGAGAAVKADMNRQFKKVDFVEEPEAPKE